MVLTPFDIPAETITLRFRKMTKWLLTAALSTGLLALSVADDTNPFKARKPEVGAKDGVKGKEKDQVKDKDAVDKDIARIAHIKLNGEMDESPVAGDSLFGAPEENFNTKLKRIQKAAKDDKIQAMLLDLSDLEVGYGKLHELQRAIADFRATGKKVFAYSEEYSSKAYLLATSCDMIGLPESGGVVLVGMRAEVTFYKNTLDLLKLKADVLKVGDYKAAVEPLLRDTMSKENREQIESMLDDNFANEMVNPIAKGRKLTPEQVREIIDQGPFTAKKAAKLGLVDAVTYEDEFETAMAKSLGTKSVKIDAGYGKAKATKLDMSNPFALMETLMGGSKKEKESSAPKIAVIYAVGAIASGKSGSGNPIMGGGSSVGSETMVEAIRKAEKDPTVKAIVLRVDSPGGSALASDVIWRELVRCKKPIVASMGDVAASGGYYISMPAKKIYAEPGTITGSIGVFGLKLVTGGLQEWAGMKTEVISRGKNTGVMSSTYPYTESERKVMTETVEDVYDQFTSKAVIGRKAAGVDMTKEKLLKIASGRVWTGRQAKANGLVDELGTLDDAIAGAKTLAGIDPKKDMELMVLPKTSSFLDKLLDGEIKSPFGAVHVDVLSLPGMQKVTKIVGPLLATQKDPIKVMMPFHVEFK